MVSFLGKEISFGGQEEHEFDFGHSKFDIPLSYSGGTWLQSGV